MTRWPICNFQFEVPFSPPPPYASVKSNRILTLALVAVLFVALMLAVWHGRSEPTYEGKSLSDWLRLYRQPIGAMAPVVSPEAADAVRHIGTNAVPFLARWIGDSRNIPPWRLRLFGLAYSRKLGTPAREIFLESVARRELRASRAIWGFVILGEAARGAIPDLVRLAHQGDADSARAAIAALGYLGKDALPPLFSMITNNEYMLKNEAMTSLSQMGYLGTNAHPAIVFLIQCLGEEDLAPAAADGLGRLHLESDISVPALVECTHSTRPLMRIWGAVSLGKFGACARSAMPDLIKLMDDPDATVRPEATNATQKIAPETLLDVSDPGPGRGI